MTRCPLPAVVFDGVIDVSHHNGAIDWPAVAGAGIALAFLKATQGTRFVDPTFERNRTGAAKAGVLVVPYHFIDGADPAGTGRAFHRRRRSGGGSAGDDRLGNRCPDRRGDDARRQPWPSAPARAPVTYYGYAQLPLADPTLSAWPLMLPAYPRGNRYGDYRSLVTRGPRLPPGRAPGWDDGQRPYDFHQYTPAGRIAGIHGPVDRSIWVGTEPNSSPGTPPVRCPG